jgi:hypothetical protein
MKKISTLTKAEMIDTIEKSNLLINFSRSYLMHKSKKEITRFYIMALGYIIKQSKGITCDSCIYNQ